MRRLFGVFLLVVVLALAVVMPVSAAPIRYRFYVDMAMSCDGVILTEPSYLWEGTTFWVENPITHQVLGSCPMNVNGRCEFYAYAEPTTLLLARVNHPNLGLDAGLYWRVAAAPYTYNTFHGEVVPFMCTEQWREYMHVVIYAQ